MRRVIIESPFAGDLARNHQYLGRAVRHSLSLGESPYASHGFFTNFLDDTDPAERKAGILAGLEWSKAADAVVYYLDLGMSPGMRFALEKHCQAARKIETRILAPGSPSNAVRFQYTNWRGEKDERVAIFKGFSWGRTEYHPADQVLMKGFCLDRREERDFAVKDMLFLETEL